MLNQTYLTQEFSLILDHDCYKNARWYRYFKAAGKRGRTHLPSMAYQIHTISYTPF